VLSEDKTFKMQKTGSISICRCWYTEVFGGFFIGTPGISGVPCQWERRKFNPHSSYIFQPIFLKLRTLIYVHSRVS